MCNNNIIMHDFANPRYYYNIFFADRTYSGQLYRADPETKEWSQVGGGIATVTILPGERRIVASRGKEKVWE